MKSNYLLSLKELLLGFCLFSLTGCAMGRGTMVQHSLSIDTSNNNPDVEMPDCQVLWAVEA